MIGPRHIEVQVLADNFGNALHFFTKVIVLFKGKIKKIVEEAPALNIPEEKNKSYSNYALNAVKNEI